MNIPSNIYYLLERNYKKGCYERENNSTEASWVKGLDKNEISNICKKYDINREELFNGTYVATSSAEEKIINLLNEWKNVSIENVELPEEYNSKNEMLFEPFYTPLVKMGISKLREISGNIKKEVEIGFIEFLFSKLVACSIRTLIFEMQICKKAKELKGNSPEEEYQYFNKILTKKDYRESIFKEYPVLLRIILEVIKNCIDNYRQFLLRIESDHSLIVDQLCEGKEFISIKKVDGQMSDTHHGGASVFKVTLDNGYQILYKPHQVFNEIKYLQLYEWCASKCNIFPYIYKIIDKDNYGWVEFVTYEGCDNKKEIENYFYRFGIQTFIVYLLGAGDIHYENLIVHGEHPVIVDCETMLENKYINDEDNAYSCVSSYINNSVLHSGLLPYFTWRNKEFGVDFSALNGINEQKVPILMPMITNEKTSNMKMIYDYPKVSGKQNVVTFCNKKINPTEYSTIIIAGFADIYNYVQNNKEEAKKFLSNLNLEKIISRQLMQNTQRYALLISTSYHPSALNNGRERELLLSKALESVGLDNEKQRFVADSEICEMLNNDVPYFYTKPNSKDLYSTSGNIYRNYFKDSSLEGLQEKINNLSDKDLMLQKEFIKASLMPTNQEQNKSPMHKQLSLNKSCDEHFNCHEMEKCISKIADDIEKVVFYNNQMDKASWIAASRDGYDQNIHWRFFPMDYFLYDGISGLAIFYSAIQVFDLENKRYNNLLKAIINSLFEYTDKFAEENIRNKWTEIGAFSGETSIVYTYLYLYKLCNKNEFLEYGSRHALLLENRLMKDNNYDILCGNAGAIHIFCKLYEMTNNEKFIKMAQSAADQLLTDAKVQAIGVGWSNEEFPCPLAGFAHGNAGIAYSLMELWKITNRQEYLDLAVRAIDYENSLFDKDDSNWKDIRSVNGMRNDEKGIRPIAWCHGAGGILLSRVEMLKICPQNMKERLHYDMERAAKTVIRGGMFKDYCLCHGTLGNLLILNEYNKIAKNEALNNTIIEMINNVSREIAEGEYISQQNNSPFFNGFMLGRAGMGYAVLKFLYPNLPNILSLEL